MEVRNQRIEAPRLRIAVNQVPGRELDTSRSGEVTPTPYLSGRRHLTKFSAAVSSQPVAGSAEGHAFSEAWPRLKDSIFRRGTILPLITRTPRCKNCRAEFTRTSNSQKNCPACSLSAITAPPPAVSITAPKKRSKARVFRTGPLPRFGGHTALRVVLAQHDPMEVTT